MGIFDVVKDVAKVGAEILPIVLDNMATGSQSKQTVPLGPIKVSVEGDQIYATNLGNQPKDVIFSVTNSTGGAMRNTNEIYNIEHGTSIVLPRFVLAAFKDGLVSVANSGRYQDASSSFVRNLGLSARLISVGLAVRIAGEFHFTIQKEDGSQSRIVFGNSNPFDLKSINAFLEGTGGAKANITLNSDKSEVTYNAQTSFYEASVNLPDGFDPEPLISSIDLQVQIDEDAANRCLRENAEMNKAFYALN